MQVAAAIEPIIVAVTENQRIFVIAAPVQMHYVLFSFVGSHCKIDQSVRTFARNDVADHSSPARKNPRDSLAFAPIKLAFAAAFEQFSQNCMLRTDLALLFRSKHQQIFEFKIKVERSEAFDSDIAPQRFDVVDLWLKNYAALAQDVRQLEFHKAQSAIVRTRLVGVFRRQFSG